ncbi:pyridoxamine 5'-phosphate oxidase family protein [Emticicia sp. 21SJ11W-3]|uniref:pyridoxamine 5'-phosphate oxidase family protein n=1 Tax=Emticicia sp. 21SJ11W-3 TaxID=2916755 RepID=UPI0020A13156|nr:pyridoxamine 5'-phosphate oxidase family protein [Emticicia sp. 21SJ11W-3]UTA70176.1 pyridoxamine 5'-phosphate oxidase family protein [Emticicia sp. 21SJ11W-3]
METKTRQDIREMVKDIKFAMLCTNDDNGHIRSRPMATQGMDEEGNIWFLTAKDSGKIDEIKSNAHVCVCYSSPSDNTYVCIMGEAEQVDDQKKIDEFWTPFAKAWFPEGKDDPNLTLIRVMAHEAEYWDSASNKIIVGIKMLSSIVTGKEYTDESAYGTVKF